ncbi:probable RNA-directed DNA polymerase from transposon X-element [Aspergillus lentulus]|nr:probable RNA-directed DNA polymerase from transposon X-element [Aspergillus lentulus]
MSIDHAGLPQGSPLSPILFLFMNTRPVKVRITDKKGAFAFVDDYTHWVIGPSAEANTARLQARIIPRALQWARESGALFEPEKTSFIHFTRNPRLRQQPAVPMWVEGTPVLARSAVKLLGIVLDQELRFRLHGAMAAKKGIQAALALKRLKGLTPKAARQLFTSTVTATVDYVASVWCTPTRDHLVPLWVTKILRATQKIAAQAIVVLFRTVSLLIAESEASIESINIRLGRRILRHWISCHTLPSTYPFWDCREAVANQKKYFLSPFKLLADHCCLQKKEVETILPAAFDPRRPTLREYITSAEGEFNDRRHQSNSKALLEMFTHSAAPRGVISVGFVARVHNATIHKWHQAVGKEERINVYYAQLGAIYEAATYVKTMIPRVSMAPSSIHVTFVTNNRTVLESLANPGDQSGQLLLCRITNVTREIVERGPQVELQWLAAHDLTEGNLEVRSLLGQGLEETSSSDPPPQWADTQLKSTLWSGMRRKISKAKIEEFQKRAGGKFTRALDNALPGKHTRLLYDDLNRQDAALLAQLRTGHAGLRGFLFAIQQSDSGTCTCGEETESVRHFLFQCRRWDHLRNDMIQAMGDRFGDLSFALGGRSGQVGTDGKPVDGDQSRWKPNLKVVRTVLRFARNTGRLMSETPGVQIQGGRYQEEAED